MAQPGGTLTHKKHAVRVGFNTAVLDTHCYGACVGGAARVILRLEVMPLTCKSLKSLVFLPFVENRTPLKRMRAAWGCI